MLFIHCLNSQIKTPAAAAAAILILSRIPCNYWQKESLSFFVALENTYFSTTRLWSDPCQQQPLSV